MDNSTNIFLSMENICKNYGGIKALDNVSVEFLKGEVHALVGENGAGKSTLIKMISGAEHPDSGDIRFGDKVFKSMTPAQSRGMGVATIYQEFNLFPTLTVAENIFMADELTNPEAKKFYDKALYQAKAQEVLDRINIDIKPTDYIEDMTTARMQLVEIAKAISKDCKLLIMDEPTAPLSTKETEYLFGLIDNLKSQGVTIIYISHRLDELYRVSDRITIMRDGHKIMTVQTEDITRKEIISHMANREVEEIDFVKNVDQGDVVLEVKNLCGNGLKDISFKVHSGEIYGLGGLLGAGRTEIARLIFGCDKLESGEILINGQPVTIKTPKQAVANGIAYVPEDRKIHGVLLTLPIEWNMTFPILKRISKGSFIDKKREQEIGKTQREDLVIKLGSMMDHVGSLSGGNQQKVVLGKWLASEPKVLILDEPTRGVDVNAKQEIYKLIGSFAEKGMAIILISSEMEELLNISDRIMVLSEKRVVGLLEKEEYSQAKVLAMASGVE